MAQYFVISFVTKVVMIIKYRLSVHKKIYSFYLYNKTIITIGFKLCLHYEVFVADEGVNWEVEEVLSYCFAIDLYDSFHMSLALDRVENMLEGAVVAGTAQDRYKSKDQPSLAAGEEVEEAYSTVVVVVRKSPLFLCILQIFHCNRSS